MGASVNMIEIPGLSAGADLSAANNLYRLVTTANGSTVTLGAAGAAATIGVLLETRASGLPIRVAALADGTVVPMRAAGAIAAGAQVSGAASGQAQVATAGQRVLGIALSASSATAGETVRVLIDKGRASPG